MNAGKGFVFLICFMSLSAFAWDGAPQKVKEGNRLYEEKQYAEALNRYHEAQVERTDAPEIPFNMGNSFYRQDRFQEARNAHAQSIQLDSGSLAAKAHYNIGNALYREGDFRGALDAYKRAIDLDPTDIDTKYNIEFIQHQLKEEKQKPQEKTPSQRQREEEPEQQQEEDSGDQGEKEDRGGKEGQDQEKAEEQIQRPEQRDAEISGEDAERLLNALQGEEKPLPTVPEEKTLHRTEVPVGKDW